MARPPIAFLTCPDCRAALDAPSRPDSAGVCTACGRDFPYDRNVTDMAPRDVPPLTRQTVSQFGASWQIHDHLAQFQHKQFLDWVSPLEPQDFKDRVILEAGSGKGRHTLIMSGLEPAHLLSLDLSDAILLAAENTKECPQTYCIRGNLLRLPVLDASVDLVVCLGVLHHLEDPLAGLKELWSKLKPGGVFCLWVYGREGNWWVLHLVDPLRRNVTSKIPTRWLRPLLVPLTLFLFILLKVLYGPATNRGSRPVGWLPYSTYLGYISKFPFLEIEHIVLDHLCPPVAYYLPKDVLEGWFRELGAEDVRLRFHNRNSWNVVAKRPS
jgi:SAM-dependent methyltransferase